MAGELCAFVRSSGHLQYPLDNFASFPLFIVFQEFGFSRAGAEQPALRRLAAPEFTDDMEAES